MRRLSGREVCKILSQHGFVEVRQRGSHIQMRKTVTLDSGVTTITVPVPNHRELKIGTLSRIIQKSLLNRSLFESKR
ncbi:MAG: type II toxin-antitoxin system HicA family toxin [Caldilineaceae bacterium SB0668_bin_21]|nr:type II toxin-antitoxin system HicA family toxin [Caldilineaceae bacterium SB0668_bin_21]MYC22083.1 type II toxin-antitoxin system HicA family toxin [Caldilineaceae bacterium SB0662_bin_25]